MSDNPQFILMGPNGSIIAKGSMSAVTEPILDSVARKDAEQLIIDASRACGLIESIQQREDALRADTVQRLLDNIAYINSRIDLFLERKVEKERQEQEQERQDIQAMLDALPDPDDPEASAASPFQNKGLGDLSSVVGAPEDPTGTVLEDAPNLKSNVED